MKKISGLLLGVMSWINVLNVYAAEKFEILPDLPEPLAAAQASSISTTNSNSDSLGLASQSVGQQIDPWTVIISLLIVILSIYAFGIIYTKLNKFGFKLMKQQMGDLDNSKVTVISTTPLGTNKTLHVVELDGKRMLLGASANSIDLIKDLGNYPPVELDDSNFSKIEIPNIRIPKIEIPKIEFPNIGFTKAFRNDSKNEDNNKENTAETGNNTIKEDEDGFVITEIYEESSDGIIDKLFTQNKEQENNNNIQNQNEQNEQNEHMVDPDDYALYKKYL